MSKFLYSLSAASILSLSLAVADTSLVIPEETRMENAFTTSEYERAASALESISPIQAPRRQELRTPIAPAFKPFTGKVKGKKVRLRVNPDLESHVVREATKDDLLIVMGEKDDFWMIQPPSGTKAYIFRSFVLDNVVEGNRVNVRLAPDLEAPIIGHLNAGTKLENPQISSTNNKWLEIPPPEDAVFYISKEFMEYAGGPELKVQMDKRKATAEQFLEAAYLVSQAELSKPFEEMDINRVSRNFTTIINEYADFHEYISQAKEALAALQEAYLQKKISYLEVKACLKAAKEEEPLFVSTREPEKAPSKEDQGVLATDKMKMWEPIEEAIYLSWSAINDGRDQEFFYDEQKCNAQIISGIVEAYTSPVKNKPGDFILKNKDIPLAYIYSTKVNLQNLVGKKVTVVAVSRPNNNFAFPAYFVYDIE